MRKAVRQVRLTPENLAKLEELTRVMGLTSLTQATNAFIARYVDLAVREAKRPPPGSEDDDDASDRE